MKTNKDLAWNPVMGYTLLLLGVMIASFVGTLSATLLAGMLLK